MTISRKVLIIANPGERFSENYCNGVFKDIENYKSFFKSPYGGAWNDSEIIVLEQPTVFQVKQEVAKLKQVDYAKIVFTGHGYYSQNKDSTIFELRSGEELNSKELQNGAAKQTIIMDCCRKIHKEISEALRKSMILDNAMKRVNPSQCRYYYDKQIEECGTFNILVYSCSINEYSRDDSQRGGYFSYTLIEETRKWADDKENSTNLTDNYYYLSISKAFQQAEQIVIDRSNNGQHPQIDKPRTSPYFPFAIVA